MLFQRSGAARAGCRRPTMKNTPVPARNRNIGVQKCETCRVKNRAGKVRVRSDGLYVTLVRNVRV